MSAPSLIPQPPTSPKHYGCRGGVIGGCLLPVLLLFVAAASGDTGGPLFWPILVALLGIIGFVTGLSIRDSSCQSMSSNQLQNTEQRPIEQQLFLTLAADLNGLLDAASTFGQTSPEWQSLADRLRDRFAGVYAPIYPGLLHDVEHYLDDSDIRERDGDYRAMQEGVIRSYIASLSVNDS